jgi:hypothetical protein
MDRKAAEVACEPHSRRGKENNMRRIVATNVRDIGKILDFVHDRIFTLSKVQFDKGAQTLSIPLTVISDEPRDLKRFLFVKTWKNPVVESSLLIKNARDYSVKDEAQIDQGAINTITKEGNHVVIKCSVPVEIRVEVTTMEIELVVSDTIASQKTRFAFG